MMIVGIDYSMSSPAMCVLSNDKTFANSQHYFLSNRKRDVSSPISNIHCNLHKPYKTNIERFGNIADHFIDILTAQLKLPTVYLEGYSLGSKGRVFEIAENTAVLKYKLDEISIPVVIIPPTVIKKYAFGKGNAKKEDMYQAFLKKDNNHPELMKFYYDKGDAKVASPVSDIVDAYFIACLGAEKYESTHPTNT